LCQQLGGLGADARRRTCHEHVHDFVALPRWV
jgi:hypothetical protein